MSDETPHVNGYLTGSDDQTKVCAALCAAQAEMPGAGFDSTNPMFRSRYASLGSVISASQPILQKHGLAILQIPTCTATIVGRMKYDPEDESEVDQIRGMVTLQTKIIHNSGQWLDGGTLELPLANQRGNSIGQVTGTLISYMRRYSWSSVLGMYADEDNDGNDPHGNRTSKPTEKTGAKKIDEWRVWAIKKLNSAPGQPNRDGFTQFLEFKGWIPKGGTPEQWKEEHVTTTVDACKALAAEVIQWDADRHAASQDPIT